MKLFISLLGLSFLLTGCGAAHIDYFSVDAQFQPILAHFEAMSAAEGTPIKAKNLVIEMVPEIKDSQTLGYCETADGQTPKIVVSQMWWSKLTEIEREELLFHELGHCLLGRVHRPESYYSLPYSLMNPYIFSSTTYMANYKQYMFELYHSQDLASALPLKTAGNTYFNPTADMEAKSYVMAQESDNAPAPWDEGVGINKDLPHCTEEHMHGHN